MVKSLRVWTLFALLVLLLSSSAYALDGDTADLPDEAPEVGTEVRDSAFPFNIISDLFDGVSAPEGVTNTVEIMLLLTVLTLVPSILVMMTAFTRIVIVLSFTRNAMGTQQTPPNQVIIGLALFLTFFVMAPVFDEIYTNAWQPYEAEEITFDQAAENTIEPMRRFMFQQIELQNHQTDLREFLILSGRGQTAPQSLADIPTHVLIPAFITSEIKTAFRMGFYIFIPFIVIDMVVASALMSMGMMMLPPVMISLPFKIMLFVLVDGWNLTIQTMIRTFQP
jgi:flagellar biosynthetic protein FliP